MYELTPEECIQPAAGNAAGLLFVGFTLTVIGLTYLTISSIYASLNDDFIYYDYLLPTNYPIFD